MGIREYYSGKINLNYKDPTLNREFKLSKLEIHPTDCFSKFAVVTFGFYFGKNNLTIPNNTENFEDFITCDAFVDGSHFILKCLDDFQISQDFDSDYFTVYLRFKSVKEEATIDLVRYCSELHRLVRFNGEEWHTIPDVIYCKPLNFTKIKLENLVRTLIYYQDYNNNVYELYISLTRYKSVLNKLKELGFIITYMSNQYEITRGVIIRLGINMKNGDLLADCYNEFDFKKKHFMWGYEIKEYMLDLSDVFDLEVNSISGLSCRSENGIIHINDTCITGREELKKMLADTCVVYTTDSDFDKVNFYERLNNEVDDRLTLTNNKQVPPVVYELRDLPPKVSIGDGVYLPSVSEVIKNLMKEEKEDMKLDNEKVNRILVNEKEGIVTVVGEKTKYVIVYGMQREKVVTMSKISKGDKFDKYIGSAFALGYWHFGSKTKFNKHLQEFYGCAPQDMENCALMDMYNKYGGKAKFEKFVDDNAKYVIKEEKKPTPKKKPKSKKDKE